MRKIVTVEALIARPLEYRGEPVVTLAQIDALHKRPAGTAKRNFSSNKKHLILGEDFFEVNQRDEFRPAGLERPQGGHSGKAILLTEMGYLMVVKSFKDDLAWQVQRKLVRAYFQAKMLAQSKIIAELLERVRKLESEAHHRKALAHFGEISPVTGFPKGTHVSEHFRSRRNVVNVTVTEYQLDIFGGMEAD